MTPTKLNVETWRNLLQGIDTVMFDCDGVLWHGDIGIEGSAEVVNYLQEKCNKKVILLTNNSTKSRTAYFEKCKKLNFRIPDKEHIVTPSHLVPHYLRNVADFNGKVYVVGSTGIGHELDMANIPHTGIGPDPSPEDGNMAKIYGNYKLDHEIRAVVVGFDVHFSYVKLMKAASYLRDSTCLFVATNDDETIPDCAYTNFICPGTGCIVSAVATASGRKPELLGKPYRHVFEFLKKHLDIDASRTLMVGDRIRTDIQLARNFGMRSLLVLTGVNQPHDFLKSEFSTMLPEFYTGCLGDILKFYDS